MSNIYYLAQIIEEIDCIYVDCNFVGIFTTRKNAEDAVYKILSKEYDKANYSTEADFLDEHFDEYTIDKVEVNVNYY